MIRGVVRERLKGCETIHTDYLFVNTDYKGTGRDVPLGARRFCFLDPRATYK